MSNLRTMTLKQLIGYLDYLNERIVSNDYNNLMFDGILFSDPSELHKYLPLRLSEVRGEMANRKGEE